MIIYIKSSLWIFFFNIDKNIIIKKILFNIFYGLIYFKYKNYNLLDSLIDKYIDINQKNLIFYHFSELSWYTFWPVMFDLGFWVIT